MSTVAEVAEVAGPQVFRSRWGFHPCDRETFVALKEYHWLLLRAFRQYRRWKRWRFKTVYRVGSEPVMFRDLTHKNHWTGCQDFNRHGSRGPNLYHHVLAQYRAARRPKADPESVAPLDLPSDWAAQVETLRAWFAPTA